MIFMRKVFYLVAICFASLSVFVSCDDNEDVVVPNDIPEDITLEVSVSSDLIPAEGGEFPLTITTTAKWTIESPAEGWITLNKLSGEGNDVITVTADANDTESRECTITISIENEELSKTVTINQEGSNRATLEDYLGTYEFTATTISYVKEGDRTNEIRETRTWTDRLRKVSGDIIQFSNMADMKNDSFAPFRNCYADFKWNGSNLSWLDTKYVYPELFGYINGGFIGCIHYESGPKVGKMHIMEAFEITLDKSTGNLIFPAEFTDPEDNQVYPASYVVFGWDTGSGKPAGIVAPYLTNLTVIKIN